MQSRIRLFALPAGLLLLIATSPTRVSAHELEWPYNLPPHVKYYPEDEALVRRNVEIQQKLLHQPATGVRKMSDDPGEMFFLDYWSFAPSVDEHGNSTDSCDKAAPQINRLRTPYANDSLTISFGPPFPLHSDKETSHSSVIPRNLLFPLFKRSLLDKQGFQCPNGTAACIALNPNVCCAFGETCQTVQDSYTGLGSVGCCPSGETCGGSLSTCPSGYTSCPSNPGGGCCIPGYSCYDVGCVLRSTATVYVVPTVTSTSIPASSPSTSSTTITKTTSSVHSTATCTSGAQRCPPLLGGGCCPSNMICGSSTCLPSSSTASGSLIAPYRPTSVDTTTTTTTHSLIPGAGCPTGYYACNAFYPGRCCQIGRDCSYTSCPTSASTTLVNSNSLTIIAPSGSGITGNLAGVTGTCASGWYNCANTGGGGCCPSGYECGTSCTATASGGQGNVMSKTAPSSAMKVYVWQDLWFAWIGILALMFYPTFR
jgi:progranulin